MTTGTVTRRTRFPYSFDHAGSPYPTPAPGAALRIAFVGQSTYFRATSLDEQSDRIRTTYVEFREGRNPDDLMAALRDHDPHVVIVFRPELIPPGLFHHQRFAALGFLTEPLPRRLSGAPVHEDLERRLWELGHVDRSNFDRIVAFDPHIAATADRVLPVWRSLPLPVADRYYAPVPPPYVAPPSVLFVGRSTPHRETLLAEAKQRFDILHLAFGVGADELEEALRSHDVGINLHNNPYPSFENRVCLHLAAGHLVLSEWLSPTHGLEPHLDFVVVQTPGAILGALINLHRFPAMWHRVRVRGRQKAEQFRASRVYPRLIGDLLADLHAFGTARAA
jgi:hypothetical protein